MRQLVTIQKIHSIEQIEGRDRIVQAKVLGYTVIVGKDQFQENEFLCFAEVDSVFPDNGHWEELRNFKFRIKQFKVNSNNGPIYGQGYVFKLDKLAGLVDWDKENHEFYEGQEITEIVGVTKYEPPIDYSSGDSKGTFPTKYLSQTDEMRLQSKPRLIDELYENPYYITTKMDGSSSTFLIAPDEKEFLVCSRNQIKRNPIESGKPCVFWKIAEQYNLYEVLQKFPTIAIQGEICGEKIQGNRLGIKGHKLYIFNLINLDNRKCLGYYDIVQMINKMKEISPNIEMVPVIEVGEFFDYNVPQLIEKSKMFYPNGREAEGIVIRPMEPMYSPTLKGGLSFKVINPEFLANGGE